MGGIGGADDTCVALVKKVYSKMCAFSRLLADILSYTLFKTNITNNITMGYDLTGVKPVH